MTAADDWSETTDIINSEFRSALKACERSTSDIEALKRVSIPDTE